MKCISSTLSFLICHSVLQADESFEMPNISFHDKKRVTFAKSPTVHEFSNDFSPTSVIDVTPENLVEENESVQDDTYACSSIFRDISSISHEKIMDVLNVYVWGNYTVFHEVRFEYKYDEGNANYYILAEKLVSVLIRKHKEAIASGQTMIFPDLYSSHNRRGSQLWKPGLTQVSFYPADWSRRVAHEDDLRILKKIKAKLECKRSNAELYYDEIKFLQRYNLSLLILLPQVRDA